MILVDAGPLVGMGNTRDADHEASKRAIATARESLIVSPMIVAEVSYLLGKWGNAEIEATFLQSLARNRFKVVDLTVADYSRMAQLVRKYADLPLGGSDASIIALAERLSITKLLTLDDT